MMTKDVVQANLRYSEVVLRIRPLTAELDKLQESLASGAARIEECKEEIATLDARKLDLHTDLSSRSEEAAELKVVPASLPPALDARGCSICHILFAKSACD